jgi:ribosomal protein S19E (S16A)
MPLVGYEEVDADDMIDSLASELKTTNPENDQWLWNSLWKTKDLLEGLMAEGYFD